MGIEKEMSYREIIRWNLRKAIEKRDSAEEKKEKHYWDWVKGQLIEDLREYEGRGRWAREPYDRAFQKYRRIVHLDLDEIMRRFFEDFW